MTTLFHEFNRIGREITDQRIRAAEAVARQALSMTPYAKETAAEFAARLRFYTEQNHPELILRFEHSRLEILPLAEDCGCDPNSDGYDDDHCESDQIGEYLCARQHLGFVCGECVNEGGNGPDWRPDRYEWPCPIVAALDNGTDAEKAGTQ